jgi:hypothetical protein
MGAAASGPPSTRPGIRHPDPDPTRGSEHHPSMRARHYVIGALTAVAVIAVIVACAFIGTAIGALNEPQKTTVNGSMKVTAMGWPRANTFSQVVVTGDTCTGYGGFADMSPGASVTLYAASGELLAATTLASGTWTGNLYANGTCTFGFTFGDVVLPGDEPGDLFMVKIGREARGSVPFTREQLTGPGPRMFLGS